MMGEIIDFSEYRTRKKRKNCLDCKTTSNDNWLNMPMCTNSFSSFCGQIVTKDGFCSYFIKRKV